MSVKNTAFLGPAGSYTELALNQFVKTDKKLSCRSIDEVFSRLISGDADSAFIPVENMLQGSVTETLDLLYKHRGKVHIISSNTFKISHCLGRLPSKEKIKIDKVFSKDIALRQCSKFLGSSFPSAELIATASTAAAAKKVSEEKLLDAAVVGAEQTLIELGFEIVDKEIADAPNNQTRFILLKSGPFKKSSSKEEPGMVTSIVVDPAKDRQGLLFEILEVISVKHRCNLNFIHSRPDSKGGFVFHLDLEGGIHEPAIEKCITELKEYCSQFTGHTAEISIFGSYAQTPFSSSTFTSVGIVGGKGAMGKWFENFFTKAGLKVFSHDATDKSSLSLSELCAKSDVILLSIPMSEVSKVLKNLSHHLNEKHLVVENCSIKSAALPQLLEATEQSVEILGLHTMFGPSAEMLRGQNVIVTKTERSKTKALAFEDLIYKHGAITTSAELDKHDHASAILQAALQCTIVCLGEFISNNFSSEKELETFSTPNSRAVVETVKRIIKQSDGLLKDLQALNPKASDARMELLQNISDTMGALEKGDSKPFIKALEASRKFFLS